MNNSSKLLSALLLTAESGGFSFLMIAIFLISMQLFTAGADFLITGNGKHFPARQYGTVEGRALLRLLQRDLNGERKAVSVVKIPTPDEEDQRRFNRERERLIKDHSAHMRGSNRY